MYMTQAMWHYHSVPQGNKGRGNIIGNSPKVILCQAAGKHECLNNFPPHPRVAWFLPGSKHTSGIEMEGGREVVIGLSSWFSLAIYIFLFSEEAFWSQSLCTMEISRLPGCIPTWWAQHDHFRKGKAKFRQFSPEYLSSCSQEQK